MPARTLLTILAATLAVLAPTTAAASGREVIADCVAGQLKSHYSASDYASALAQMPADVAEYSGCAGDIAAARSRDVSSTALATAARAKVASAAAGGAPDRLAATPTGGADVAGASEPGATYTSATAPASTTPRVTTPIRQTAPIANSGPGDGTLAALTLGGGSGDDGPTAGSGHGLPIIPIVIALSVIALSLARALTVWSDRPERIEPGSETA